MKFHKKCDLKPKLFMKFIEDKFVDGTFYIAPKFGYQVFIIRTYIKVQKKQAIYEMLFEEVIGVKQIIISRKMVLRLIEHSKHIRVLCYIYAKNYAVYISIFFGAYINKCQNGMVFTQIYAKNHMVLITQKTQYFHSTSFIDSTTLTLGFTTLRARSLTPLLSLQINIKDYKNKRIFRDSASHNSVNPENTVIQASRANDSEGEDHNFFQIVNSNPNS
ncbi:hypothetical protein H8356DRAFT_1323447 [Neocallimastix lanati (nom. inval.)]|nr:hypothetical protein H8356DRAFT_1323447 [Neocallimastix sp. JGI-2020a]